LSEFIERKEIIFWGIETAPAWRGHHPPVLPAILLAYRPPNRTGVKICGIRPNRIPIPEAWGVNRPPLDLPNLFRETLSRPGDLPRRGTPPPRWGGSPGESEPRNFCRSCRPPPALLRNSTSQSNGSHVRIGALRARICARFFGPEGPLVSGYNFCLPGGVGGINPSFSAGLWGRCIPKATPGLGTPASLSLCIWVRSRGRERGGLASSPPLHSRRTPASLSRQV
jgi:hypothetical protein